VIAHQDVVGTVLRVLDEDIEVAALVEDAGVAELELGLGFPGGGSPRPGGRRGSRLRILVERLHVGVRRRGVEVEVELLDVLAVVALGSGQAEEPLLEDGVAPVPQRHREAEAALAVVRAEQPSSPQRYARLRA
jgi:plasmid stabilization system protein ParE